MYTKKATATHKDKPAKQYVWTDDSEKTLTEWKDKINARFPNKFTFSDLEDNPELAKRAQLKAVWEQVSDPKAKQLLKILLNDMLED